MAAFEFISRLSGATIISAAGAAWWYRPILDHDKRNKSSFFSSHSCIDISDYCNKPRPILITIATNLNFTFVVSVSMIFMKLLGSYKIKENDKYKYFLKAVLSRGAGVPLITVSNHRSLVDDPAMMACLTPVWVSLQPHLLRWNICTHEICFENGALIATFFGAGKTLPIQRGLGLNQKYLLNFARHAACGEWLHIFPEAGCWQRDTLGGRANGREKDIGRLKWGVGKLIAHSPRTPIVIPFFHSGMETIMPKDPVTNKWLDPKIPRPGHNVTVRFGLALDFSDLIQEHEKQFGPLWKYAASAADATAGSCWQSKPTDYILYNKITSRIEESLLSLNEEALEDLKVMKSTGSLPA